MEARLLRFLVFGSLAWDIPIRLQGSLTPGGRVKGESVDGNLAGRLGGGAANAGCALVGAGHDVRVVSVLSSDSQGRIVAQVAREYGLALDFVAAHDFPSSKTLIFLDRDGERTIVGLDAPPIREKAMSFAHSMPDQFRIDAFGPAGVYLRSFFPGCEQLTFGDAVVVAHWPVFTDRSIDATVLVASASDLGHESVEDFFAEAGSQVSARLEWVVITRGREEVIAFDGRQRIEHDVIERPQVDTTGAGDVFAAGLMEALAAGADMHAALAHAARWGALAVSMEGSAANPGQQSAYASWSC